jgi:hypothetical protein
MFMKPGGKELLSVEPDDLHGFLRSFSREGGLDREG